MATDLQYDSRARVRSGDSRARAVIRSAGCERNGTCCPNYTCASLYGAYGPYGGVAYWSRYTYGGWDYIRWLSVAFSRQRVLESFLCGRYFGRRLSARKVSRPWRLPRCECAAGLTSARRRSFSHAIRKPLALCFAAAAAGVHRGGSGDHLNFSMPVWAQTDARRSGIKRIAIIHPTETAAGSLRLAISPPAAPVYALTGWSRLPILRCPTRRLLGWSLHQDHSRRIQGVRRQSSRPDAARLKLVLDRSRSSRTPWRRLTI